MVSSLLGGSPLTVDAIPDENGFIPDGEGFQITNHSHARLGRTNELNYNSTGFLPNAGPASMDTGFSTVDVPSQQTVDPRILVGNWDNTGFSIQPENPERLWDTGYGLGEPFNDVSSTAYDDLSATGFPYDEVAPAGTHSNLVDLECYSDIDISPDTTLKPAELRKIWFQNDGTCFRCKICRTLINRDDNCKRHLGSVNCKAALACLDKAERRRIVLQIEMGLREQQSEGSRR